jgi:hypothetical protein
MNVRISVIVITLLIGATFFSSFQWYRAAQRADAAEAILRSQRDMAAYASSMQSATFVRADSKAIVYRTPQEVKVGGQTFINAIEHSAGYSSIFTVFGKISGTSPAVLRDLYEGAPIRILVHSGLVEALYVSP